ncbi:MAG: type I DNA topoisomerase [Zetaproteobacteria bacterium]|nr:type I DNA topoisomerase [Zetaproteobacteria bacterium]
MSKSLVIVESPAKVKSISKFLGKNFIVKSSVGHVRDLASVLSKKPSGRVAGARKNMSAEEKQAEAEDKLFARMGLYPEEEWRANYETLPSKDKVVAGLRKAAEGIDCIYLATDLDREGEAIAWHLMQAIGGEAERYKRVTFTEITKKAVQSAFDQPGELNTDRVNAQQARRFLDRVVGFMVSPLLWEKVARGLSAGRVQSVAVRLVTEREREIHAFKPEEYWDVHVQLGDAQQNLVRAEVRKWQGSAFRPTSMEESTKHVQSLRQGSYELVEVESKPSRSKPSAPFITSTLQQAASTRLGFGVKKTMTLAQSLYETGRITYMRTDSTNLSVDAVAACREYIGTKFGDKYLPAEPIKYSNKKSAQEAHEAIRPTEITWEPDEVLLGLDRDHARLYELIWQQFVACQMSPAEYLNTNFNFVVGDYQLRAKGRVLVFDGCQRVQPPLTKKNDDAQNLPDWQPGIVLEQKDVLPKQHFTKPPPRYTEASLVRELEKRGIGRPSTYASIISTIQERGYVKAENRRFFCLKMGEIVTDRLGECFEDLMDYGFTASLEQNLDAVAQGGVNWIRVLDDFYHPFKEKLLLAKESMRPNSPIEIDVQCSKCERNMQIRTARTGVFLGCSGYNLPVKERCKETVNLVSGEEVEAFAGEEEEGNVEELRAKKRCQICDTAMDSYLIDEQRKLHVCGNSPDCEGYLIEQGKFRIKGYEGPIIECDRCSADMQLRTGRFGKYFACTRAPECKNTRKLLRSGEVAPPKADPIMMPELPCAQSDGHFVLRDGAAGLFLASSEFPKSRETRKPQVADLIRHKEKLDPKYAFLTDAPVTDPNGNPTLVRFSRKTKEHYIASECEGKATKWTLYYMNGAWKQP